MARARGKQTLQIGLPEGALDDLDMIAPTVGKSIGQRGITPNQVAAWAVQHVLGMETKLLLKAIHAGIAKEHVYLGIDEEGQVNGSGRSLGSVTTGTTKAIPRRIDGCSKHRTEEHAAGAAVKLD